MLADQVLYSGVACIVELVLKEGLINLDFADVRTVMSGMGTAMMGTGEATGERRAILAAEEAIANPLLDDVTLKGAKGLLLSITGGRDMTLYEVDEAASRVRQEVDPDANIIVGATFDDHLGDRVRVSIVASGMGRLNEQAQSKTTQPRSPAAAQAPPAPQSWQHQQQQPASPAYSGQYAQNMHGLASPLPGDEMQRRLKEVLEAAQGPQFAAGSLPVTGQQYEPRPAWAGPGNVMIEDGLSHFPQLSGAALGRTPSLPPQAVPAIFNPHSFQPQAPVEFERTARRMPSVEDFPDVGQRDWRSKTSAGGQTPGAAQDSGRKQGFFGRISGLAKRATESSSADNGRGPGPAGQVEDESAIPIFFGRERR